MSRSVVIRCLARVQRGSHVIASRGITFCPLPRPGSMLPGARRTLLGFFREFFER